MISVQYVHLGEYNDYSPSSALTRWRNKSVMKEAARIPPSAGCLLPIFRKSDTTTKLDAGKYIHLNLLAGFESLHELTFMAGANALHAQEHTYCTQSIASRYYARLIYCV